MKLNDILKFIEQTGWKEISIEDDEKYVVSLSREGEGEDRKYIRSKKPEVELDVEIMTDDTIKEGDNYLLYMFPSDTLERYRNVKMGDEVDSEVGFYISELLFLKLDSKKTKIRDYFTYNAECSSDQRNKINDFYKQLEAIIEEDE